MILCWYLKTKASTVLNAAIDRRNRLQSMLHHLLEYSRVSTRGRSFESVDLAELAQELLEEFQEVVEKEGVQITCDELPIVNGDEMQLFQ